MNTFLVRIAIAFLIFTEIGRAADPLDTWSWANPLPPGNNFSAVTYGNSRFVAVGWNGTILTSTDRIDWFNNYRGQGQDSPTGIVYGNGDFVAVGSGGTILQSGSIVTLAIAAHLGNGLQSLSLEGPSGLDYAIQTSTDLISWRDVTKISNTPSSKVTLDGLPDTTGRQFYRAYSQ